jgi:hypothetical protein
VNFFGGETSHEFMQLLRRDGLGPKYDFGHKLGLVLSKGLWVGFVPANIPANEKAAKPRGSAAMLIPSIQTEST